MACVPRIVPARALFNRAAELPACPSSPALRRRQAVHRRSRKSAASRPRSAGHGAQPEEADAAMSTAAPS
jgi:hypothetical protein